MQLDPRWDPWVRESATSALCVDFDGTLAPIVDDPAAAAPLTSSLRALTALAGRLRVVAVVTGRPVEFVRRHVADPAIVVIGQYGLESDRDGVVRSDPRAAPYEAAVAAAAADAAARWPALDLERKGRVAATLHWRRAPEHAPTDDELAALAARHGLARFPGRMACELRPPVPVDKGTALAGVLAECTPRAAAFAGDDHGDLAAFATLEQWARAAPARVALRVAVASSEAPAALLEAADVVVDGPPALAATLEALAAARS